jgi:hypothetical protein
MCVCALGHSCECPYLVGVCILLGSRKQKQDKIVHVSDDTLEKSTSRKRGILFRGREFQEVFVERVTLEHSQDIR